MARPALALTLLLAGCATPQRSVAEPPPPPPAVERVPLSPPEAAPVPAPALTPERAKASAVLDEALSSTEPALRSEAHVALGMSKRPGARDTLEVALASEDGKLRFAAARGLRYLGDPEAVDALAEAWSKEKGWAVRKELALAAAASEADDLVPFLREALKDPNAELVHAAAWALDSLGDSEGTAVLEKLGRPAPRWRAKAGSEKWSRKLLSGAPNAMDRHGRPVTERGSPEDRALAARTLAELGTDEDAALAASLLDAPEPLVRLYAAALVLRAR